MRKFIVISWNILKCTIPYIAYLQDGGIMHNNPTCVAIHECKLLWPDEPIQSVISLGNGRYEPNIELMSSLPSAKKQIDNIIDSATNTESKPLFLV